MDYIQRSVRQESCYTPPAGRCTSGSAFGLHASCLPACRAGKNSSVVVIAVVVALTSSFFLGSTDPPSPDAFSYFDPGLVAGDKVDIREGGKPCLWRGREGGK